MRRILTSLSLVAVTIFPATLHAQTQCATRDHVVQRLATGYGESFQGGGLQSATKVFEVWFSEEKGTWTILMTRSDGTSCVMASGTDWRGALPSDEVLPGTPG